jgi:hypothetical protein
MLLTKNVTLGYSDGSGCACNSPVRTKGASVATAKATTASFMDFSPLGADRSRLRTNPQAADFFHNRCLAAFGKVEFWFCDQVFVTKIGSRRLEGAHVRYWH